MPPGSMAIYREVTGGDDFDSTSWVDVDHDTTVHEDAMTFDKEVSAGTALLEDGHYLALWSERSDISGTLDRVTHHGQLVLDGTHVYGSYGHGYIRGDEGCDECFLYGSAMFSASASDVLKVQINEEQDTSPSPVRAANHGSLQVLKLDDNWDFCIRRAYRPGVIQDVGDDITWWSDVETDSGSFTVSGSTITLEQAGWYLCSYCLGWNNGSTPPARLTCYAWVELDGTAIPQSYSSSYVRVTSGIGGYTCALFMIYATSASLDLIMKTAANGYGGGTFGVGEACTISLAKLPDDLILPLDIYDSTGGQSFDVTETPFDWDAENEDSAAFSHDTGTNPDNIVIAKPGPFLFTGNFYGDRSSGTNRYNTLAKWRKNGTALSYGMFGDYNRGDKNRTPQHGASHGILFPWLSKDDIIELAREDTSTSSGSAPTTVADQMGVQAVHLPSIFPGFYMNGGWFLQ